MARAGSRPAGLAGRPRARCARYLGIAPGVGKTYADAPGCARPAAAPALDAVVGVLGSGTAGGLATVAQLGDLEAIPARTVMYRGAQALPSLECGEAVLDRASRSWLCAG